MSAMKASPTITLNICQTPDELRQVYDTNYYWYLRSPAFVEAFHKPLGAMVNRLGLPCLDVGCGEGWLADQITVPYTGIDGSAVAIERAREQRPGREFRVDRFEAPALQGEFPVVIFGGILDVLVQRDSYVPLLELYRERFGVRHFIIYDLLRLHTDDLVAKYKLAESYQASAVLDLQEVKRHRKILRFDCQ
jgi:SAM-dependent methyltransferase